MGVSDVSVTSMSSSFTRRAVGAGRRTTAETLAYVRSLPELGTTVLLGGLLWAYGVWLVVPGLFVMGFFVRIVQHVTPPLDEPDVTPRRTTPPRFDDWLSLLVDGAKVYVVWTVYLFLAFTAAIPYGEGASAQLFVILLRTMLGNVGFLIRVRAALGVDDFAVASAGTGAVDYPGVVLFLASMYVAPAALLNLAARGHLRDGFAFDDIRAIVLSRTYLSRWLVFASLWLTSLAVLYLPAGWVASTLVPAEWWVLAEAVRESIELLRGILSFALLGLGYVVLGRVPVPPTDPPSVRGFVRVVYGTRLGSVLRRDTRFGRTLLVASLLAVFWSLPAVVLLAGYLARFVRAVGVGEPPPRFDRLGSLVVDGARAVALWVVYATAPLLSLVLWWKNDLIDPYVLTALTAVPGLGFGTWYLGRDYFNALTMLAAPTLDPGLLAVSFLVTSLATLYVFPAAFCRFARDDRFAAGFDARRLIRDISRPTYVIAWLRAVVLLALGAALSLSWNWWRMDQPGFDTETLVSIRGVNFVTLPTGLGMTSSSYLLAVSAVGMLLLFRAYSHVAHVTDERTKADADEE